MADTPDAALIEAIVKVLDDPWEVFKDTDGYNSFRALPTRDLARAAYAAMVEHLGLTEDWAVRFERYADPTMADLGVITVEQRVGSEVIARAAVKNRVPISAKNRRVVRRLVSKWEEVQS